MKNHRIATGFAALGLAGLVAVAGVASSANAKSTIHGSDIAHNTITGANVKSNSLTGGDIQNRSLHSVDYAVGSVSGTSIKNGTITLADISSSTKAALKGQTGKPGIPGVNGKQGVPGKSIKGDKGDKGDPGAPALAGAVYRTETYLNGGGGSATVACADTDAESQNYVAISGGVQGSVSGVSEKQDGFLISSSFPGRMDWSTGKPKANRLDGWIVFGNSQHTDTLVVWALCVPKTSTVAVVNTDLDN